jgi:hypothetical protein
MREFLLTHVKFEHLLCALILISRIGDIGSTYLVTPKLKLEANPIVRKLGWWFGLATVFVCLVPYWNTAAGVIALIPSLLVCASNTSRIWFVRAYGENEYLELLLRLARKSKVSHAIAGTLVSAGFIALIGMVLLLLCPDPTKDWGYWIGFGFLGYALVIGLYGSLYLVRLFRTARRMEEQKAVIADASLPK